MVLEGRVQVGLGRVASVAGLGEEGQVGETEPSSQGPVLARHTFPTAGGIAAVDHGTQQEQQEEGARDDHPVRAARPAETTISL